MTRIFLGGEWYTPNVEQEIIRISDRLIATAPIFAKWKRQAIAPLV